MSDTMSATTDQWMQFYQQPLNLIEGFSDATVVTTRPPMSSEDILMSPRNSYTTTTGQLSPIKGNAFKPIRRRSRASKRTPTTLLNANTANFRELVQKFTGCPSTSMSSFSVHNKGPITLNFQQGSKQQQIHHHNTTTRTLLPFGTTSYNQVHDHVHVDVPLPYWQKQPEEVPKQELLQEQQSDYSLDEQTANAFYYDTKINDGFFM